MSTAKTPAQAISDVKADVVADVAEAKNAVSAIGTAAKADLAKFISDLEDAKGVSMDAVKSVLGIK